MVRARLLCDDCGTMTSTASSSGERPFPRRATRSTEDRFLGGVAAGLADHLGLDPLPVRAGFIVSSIFGGFGVLLYLGLWMVLPSAAHLESSTPGQDAATRQGKRPGRTRRLQDFGPLVAVGVIALGVVVLARDWLGGSILFWPLVLGVVGLVVLWMQADEVQRERWVDSSGRVDLLGTLVGKGGATSYARLAGGVVLVLAAIVLFALQTGDPGAILDVLIAGVLGVVGLGLMVGPWLFRLAGDLSEERTARVRSEERADMAAHLHDSVLQTLALIQKHADDGRTVSTLARAQERDLRNWLYGEQGHPETSVAGALKAAAAEVEDAHGVPVEVVTVGDCPVTERLRPLVAAAREAMVNAAKHAGADKVDVFAECREGPSTGSGPDGCEVFVRDRGRGFDQDQVPADRLGIRNSIVDRMQRHGGNAVIRSAPGEGTEVRLSMSQSDTAGEDA
jgi:signal transduction histidine kinase/phage shock protein PspC (stress-responsive transcriptional regulator)